MIEDGKKLEIFISIDDRARSTHPGERCGSTIV